MFYLHREYSVCTTVAVELYHMHMRRKELNTKKVCTHNYVNAIHIVHFEFPQILYMNIVLRHTFEVGSCACIHITLTI